MKGIKDNITSRGVGNHILRINVKLPRSLTSQQRMLLQAFEGTLDDPRELIASLSKDLKQEKLPPKGTDPSDPPQSRDSDPPQSHPDPPQSRGSDQGDQKKPKTGRKSSPKSSTPSEPPQEKSKGVSSDQKTAIFAALLWSGIFLYWTKPHLEKWLSTWNIQRNDPKD